MLLLLITAASISTLNTETIKTIRTDRKLTMAQAAERAGFKRPSQWADIESGRQANLSIGTLERVAAALGVKAAKLLV